VERTELSQMYHDRMIKQLADSLVSKRFRDVRADHPDSPQRPAPVMPGAPNSWHIPDVTAMGIQMVLFEVETVETIDDPHTADEWKSFAQYAHDNGAEFWVVVPKASIENARDRMARLRLDGKVMGL